MWKAKRKQLIHSFKMFLKEYLNNSQLDNKDKKKKIPRSLTYCNRLGKKK